MKIALVVERFEPGAGGVETVVHQLASELARRRETVTVVCRSVGAPTPSGVAVVCLQTTRFWQPLRVRRFSAAAERATAHGFDVVHGFSRTRTQHIYRAGGGSHAAYLERMYRFPRLQRLSPRHQAILGIEEAVFRDPRQIIQCNSRMVAAEIGERYRLPPDRIAVIYNGVDTVRFRARRHPGEAISMRADLGVDGPLALFVGHGFARKGLARAIDGLAESGVSATLLVAGRGDPRPYERQARARGVSRRVRFLGPRSDLETLYAAADLFVLPTHYDAFANVCLEAMASGLPVATTPTNGAAELIVHGVNGFVCEGDFAEIFGCLEDRDTLAELGRAARTTAEQYTWARHTDAVLSLYARVAA